MADRIFGYLIPTPSIYVPAKRETLEGPEYDEALLAPFFDRYVSTDRCLHFGSNRGADEFSLDAYRATFSLKGLDYVLRRYFAFTPETIQHAIEAHTTLLLAFAEHPLLALRASYGSEMGSAEDFRKASLMSMSMLAKNEHNLDEINEFAFVLYLRQTMALMNAALERGNRMLWLLCSPYLPDDA